MRLLLQRPMGVRSHILRYLEEDAALYLDLFCPELNDLITVIYSPWEEQSDFAFFSIEIHDHTLQVDAAYIIRFIADLLPSHEIVDEKEIVLA